MSFNPLAAIQSAIAALTGSVPQPASTMPPGINVAGTVGTTTTKFALGNHTHASSVQCQQIAGPSTGNTVVWTFPSTLISYSVPPVVFATVLNAAGATQPYVANIVSTTTTSATIAIFAGQATTLGSALSSLLGAVISPFKTTIPAGLQINCLAHIPTM